MVDQLRDKILAQVKQKVLKHLTGTSAKVYLFGSWAREEERRSSDIDVAIELKPDNLSAHALLTNIRHALEESTIPYHVDVVHLNSADEAIINKVRKEGILWHDQMND